MGYPQDQHFAMLFHLLLGSTNYLFLMFELTLLHSRLCFLVYCPHAEKPLFSLWGSVPYRSPGAVSKGASLSGVEKDTERPSILVSFCCHCEKILWQEQLQWERIYFRPQFKVAGHRRRRSHNRRTWGSDPYYIHSQKMAAMSTCVLVSSLLSRLLCSLDPLPGEQFHPQQVGLLTSIKVVCWVAKPSANIVVNANYSQ